MIVAQVMKAESAKLRILLSQACAYFTESGGRVRIGLSVVIGNNEVERGGCVTVEWFEANGTRLVAFSRVDDSCLCS